MNVPACPSCREYYGIQQQVIHRRAGFRLCCPGRGRSDDNEIVLGAWLSPTRLHLGGDSVVGLSRLRLSGGGSEGSGYLLEDAQEGEGLG